MAPVRQITVVQQYPHPTHSDPLIASPGAKNDRFRGNPRIGRIASEIFYIINTAQVALCAGRESALLALLAAPHHLAAFFFAFFLGVLLVALAFAPAAVYPLSFALLELFGRLLVSDRQRGQSGKDEYDEHEHEFFHT
jgi:hypothetical protein